MSYQRPGKQAKMHKEDIAAAHEISIAVRFAAHFRKGPREMYNHEFDNLTAARSKALELNGEHGQFGRRSVVYAISATGSRFPVPDAYQPAA